MKFVLVKSNLGFADRFQLLCFIIQYAKKTNRTLVVDWTDEIWSGNDPNKDFYYYFHFKDNIKFNVMSLREFKKWYINHIKEGNTLSIFPKNVNILTRSYGKSDMSKDNSFNNTFIDITVKDSKIKDYSDDLVVVLGNDSRSTNCLVNCRHIEYNDNILHFINEDNFNINIINKKIPYCTVHLRGADRMAYHTLHRLSNNSTDVKKYVSDLYNKIPDKYEHILILTDTQLMLDTFLEILNDSGRKVNIYQTNNIKINLNETISKKTGLHLLNDNKEIKILQMLKDFTFMVKSNNVICDSISLFSLVAGNICKILKAKNLEDLLKI
jgi:hypothetical protein